MIKEVGVMYNILLDLIEKKSKSILDFQICCKLLK